MKLSELLPPSDLLKQFEGIESGLKQRYRLGMISLIATLIQVVLLIANNEQVQKFITGNYTQIIEQYWLWLFILVSTILSFLLFGWARFWLEESQSPFRYTYSIVDFKPIVDENDENGKDVRLSKHLAHDLAQRLNERIKRLSLIAEEHLGASIEAQAKLDESKQRSHIQIGGHYVFRLNPDNEWFVEVMPRVRIGPPGSSETLAYKTKFKMPEAPANLNKPPELAARQYEQILERVYFSVATEIYKQIQLDVQNKIKLLPTNYYRAVALLHEAEDYAGSNTLDAYNEALGLYEKSMLHFDPRLRPLKQSLLPRISQCLYQSFELAWLGSLRVLAFWLPRFGKVELLSAKAKMGYANMLIYRRSLASILAQRVNPVYKAKPIAHKAVASLERLSEDVSGRKDSLFASYVTLALAWSSLGSIKKAEEYLDKCISMEPVKAETDAKYLFAVAEVKALPSGEKLQLYQRAVELEPRFDVAQFSKALLMEMEWRKRLDLASNVAGLVINEYKILQATNPGNVAAWSNCGYIWWLLGDAEQARKAFELGREYKVIKRETYVAELDYGLGRIAAEDGDFDTAYKYFDSGLSALLALGVAHNSTGYTDEFYYYTFISETIMKRFDRYKETVEGNLKFWKVLGAFKDLVEKLGDKKSRKWALKTLVNLLHLGDKKLDSSERKTLEDWMKTRMDKGPDRAMLGASDLTSFAGQLEQQFSPSRAWDNELCKEIQKCLSEDFFARLMNRCIPKRRIRDAVYAFVLDDYATACVAYYWRFGGEKHLKRSRLSYRKAISRKKDFLMPYYRLYKLEPWGEKAEYYLETVNNLAPSWPDGMLASCQYKVDKFKNKRKAKEEEARKKKNEAENFLADAKSKLAEVERIDKDLLEKRKILTETERRSKEPQLRPGWDKTDEEDIYDPRRPQKRGESKQFLIDTNTELDNQRKMIGDLEATQVKLKIEANKVQEKASQAKKKAEGLHKNAATIKLPDGQKIDKDLKYLLPHEWLWKNDKKSKKDIAELNLQALHSKKFDKELKWEGELNALHVSALFAWAQNFSDDKDKEKLFEHIETHFWADDFYLLDARRRLSGNSDNERNKRMRGIIENSIHDAYLVLRDWINNEVFDDNPEEDKDSEKNIRAKFCKKISELDSLSSPCYELLGKLFEQQQYWDDALRAYQCAQKLDSELYADYPLRIGRNLLAMGKENAIKEFEAYGGKISDKSSSWRTKVVEDTLRHIVSRESYSILKSWLEREHEKCLHVNDTKGALVVLSAIMLLMREKHLKVNPLPSSGASATGMFPVVTPIAVEADGKLVKNKEDQDNFLNELITVREKIKSDIGVYIPGIRLRGNEENYLNNAYIISINEVPIVLGKVEPEKRFSPGYQQSQQDSYNPRTEENEGEWLDEESAKGLGIEHWHYREYAAYHLEAVLRSDLTQFVGLQETRDMLDVWQESDGKDEALRRRELVSELLPDADSLMRLTQLLQGLVKECVPITNLVAILHSFRASKLNSDSLIPTVEAARLRLKGELPGNSDEYIFMALAPAFEAEIESNILTDSNGKRFFAIEPELTQELLAAFRAGIADKRQGTLVIVTQTEGIRSFVRRLIEIEFPRVKVLSSHELRPELLEPISETIEYP